MLLVADIGNTNLTFGVFKGDKKVVGFRLSSKTIRTSDEYGLAILGLLRENGIDKSQIDDVMIASVVPNIMHSFKNSIYKYLQKKPYELDYNSNHGLLIDIDNPAEIGADRIADGVGAYELFGGPVMVIDFGTATKYDVIDGQGKFITGITSPGIKICARALWEQTAKLPDIRIEKPHTILAKNTVTSMQAGLVYGYIGQTEYIIKKVIEEMAIDLKVVATGGLGRIIYKETSYIDSYDPDLTLKGLNIIYKRMKRN